MPDLATIIAQQAELVSRQQLELTRALREGDGSQRPIGPMPRDAFNDVAKSLTLAVDKYATLLYVQRDTIAAS